MFKLEEVTQALTLLVIAVIVTVIGKWQKWIVDHLKNLKGKKFNQDLEIRTAIDQDLFFILEKMGANRCCIYEFSNGESSLASVPFQYIRMTYEKCDDSVTPLQKELDKVSVNSAVISLSKMKEDSTKVFIYEDNDEEEIRRRLKYFKAKQEIRVKIGQRLQDGLIGVWYHNDYHLLTSEEEEYLKQKGYEINMHMSRLKKNH